MGSEDIFTLPRRDSDLVSTSTGSGSAFLKEGQGPVEMLEFALKIGMESLPGQYWAIFDVFDGERIGLYN